MPDYRRFRAPGGSFFFTVMLAPNSGARLTDQLHLLRIAYAQTLAENPFRTDAIVILPDHLHAVWTLPEGDSDYSLRWQKIKSRFTRMITQAAPRRPSDLRKGERGIWQRRFWEHMIRNASDHRRHIRYCWSDPVRHGLAAKPSDWTASSIHRDIRLGKVSEDWAAVPDEGSFGERAPDLVPAP